MKKIVSSHLPFKQKNRIWILWMLAAGFLIFQLLAHPGFPSESVFLTLLAQFGTLMIAFGVIGRLWSIVYIGGRKNLQLLTDGPYSMSRNPLYLFSMCIIVGVGLVFGSLLATAIFSLLAYCVFRYTAIREADYLSHLFGQQYSDYAFRTPLFWPALTNFRWGAVPDVSHRALFVSARDSLFTLALIPLSELVEYLREEGFLETLWNVF